MYLIQNVQNIFKRYGSLDKSLVDKILEDKKEIERTLENIKGLDVSNSNIINDYQVYIKRKKQDSNRQKWLNFTKNRSKDNDILPSVDGVCSDANPNIPENSKENESKTPQVKSRERIKALHKKWNKAAEVMDEIQSPGIPTPNHTQDEEDNPNLLPIITPWWKNLDENRS